METRKPAPLKALTGLRCFAAINIVLFHFSNPQWFNFNFAIPTPFSPRRVGFEIALAPVVNAGFISVSYFILLSGFVLAYNYAERARNGELDRKRFWEARFTRIYPIYFLSLLLSLWQLPSEYRTHTHAMFWTGMVLTPLLLQGWIPAIATFMNTPAWTMSAEAFYYLIFPWAAKLEAAEGGWARTWRRWPGMWVLGLVPGALYMAFNPDGIAHPDRWSYGPWLWALKYTPYSHVFSFLFGVMLADLDQMIERKGRLRLVLGIIGFGGDLRNPEPGAAGAVCDHPRRTADAAVCAASFWAWRARTRWPARWACGRWCSWARPATASTCCTSTCGT